MAKIPTRTSSQELPAGPNQLPSVRMTAAPTADQLGGNARLSNESARRDVTSALDHFSRANEIIERREDNTAVFAALYEAQEATATQQAELGERKGASAAGSTDDTRKWFDDNYEKHTSRLGNDRQRRAFDDQWQKLRVNGVVYASKHQVVEGRRALADAAKATVVGAVELSAANPSDTAAFADNRDQVLVASQNIAAAAGHKAGSSAAILEQLTNLSMLHETTVAAIAKNDPAAAEAHLKQYSGEMNASTRERVTKVVEISSRLRGAQTFADEAVAKGMTEAEAITAARGKLEGEAEKDTVAEIKTRFAEVAGARERQQRGAADEAWKIVDKTGSLAQVDPMILAAMDGKSITAIRDWIEQKAFREESRSAARESRAAAVESRAAARENRVFIAENRVHARETRERAEKVRMVDEAYQAARKMMHRDPEGFAKTNWRESIDTLSFDQIQSLRALQDKPPVKDFLTYEQQLGRATATMDKGERATFQMSVDNAVRRETDTKGKELTQTERQDVITRMETDYKLEQRFTPSWMEPKRKGYELTPDTKGRAYLPDMPELPQAAVQAVMGGVPKDRIQSLVDKAKQFPLMQLTPELLLQQYQHENRKK